MRFSRDCPDVGSGGTEPEWIEVASIGALSQVRARRAQGQDGETIAREVIAQFREILGTGSFGEMGDETLMAVVQRSIREGLAEPLGADGWEFNGEEPSESESAAGGSVAS
jgi:hypothetical protein